MVALSAGLRGGRGRAVRDAARGDDQSLATDLGSNPETSRNWLPRPGAGPSEPPGGACVRAELAALRRENAETKKEREILRSAARSFARELCSVRC